MRCAHIDGRSLVNSMMEADYLAMSSTYRRTLTISPNKTRTKKPLAGLNC